MTTVETSTAPVLAAPDGELVLDLPRARRAALLRTCLVAAAVVAALPWSLGALVSDFRYAGALGDLVLVPVCAFLLALVAAWRHPWTAALRPGRADWVLAGLATASAVGLLTVGPVVAGNLYYALRPDLLAVPLVAVAAVCLLLGVRALVGLTVPLLLLLLTWPLPLRAVLEPAAETATAVTAGALRLVLHVLPLASTVDAPGDLRLSVAGPSGAFEVVVASACSGLTGIAGTLLVGIAAQYVLHGSARARVQWLSTAVALAWTLNLVRILLLLAVGRLLGERVALDVVHPVAGLLLLNASFAVLLLVAPRYGLRFGLGSPVPADTPLTEPAPVGERMDRSSLLRRGAALTAAVAVLGVLNTVLPATSGAYDAADPAATAFSDAPVAPAGYATGLPEPQPWSRVYYGPRSDWTRYRLTPTGSAPAPSLWVDSVTTQDWAALRAHPLLDCYRFHGFSLQRVSRTVLAAGVLADEIVFRRPDGATWHVLSWQWPVRAADGGPMRFERVVLLASSERDDLAPAVEATQDRASAPGSGLRALLAARLGAAGSGTDPNPGLAAALRAAADDLVISRLAGSGGVR